MESVGLAIEVNIICIVVLFLVRQSNREAASLLLCARALNRLLDFFIAFAALEIVGKLLAPEAVVACRIIECLKVIACLAIAAAWFYMVCYAVTSSSYKLQKWAILILAPIVIGSGTLAKADTEKEAEIVKKLSTQLPTTNTNLEDVDGIHISDTPVDSTFWGR